MMPVNMRVVLNVTKLLLIDKGVQNHNVLWQMVTSSDLIFSHVSGEYSCVLEFFKEVQHELLTNLEVVCRSMDGLNLHVLPASSVISFK